uniref:DUF4283 domain-containing protein n=1 Tax=Noccaea caerulescens TaxID=107243 RepID=A0A1J3G604_NOCCA
MIHVLSKHWELAGRAIGSDLRHGCFQFRFDSHEDLQNFIANRPYHFVNWMVILHKWEPVISSAFPSKIPFWIRLQGLPLHYWKESMLHDIGEAIGDMNDHELTMASAKIRVTIDGLQPLTKEMVIEFSNGEEAIVSLEYDRLKNHCSICFRLTHMAQDCSEYQQTHPLPPRERKYREHTPKSTASRDQPRDFILRQNRYGKPFGDRPSNRESQQPPHRSYSGIPRTRQRDYHYDSGKTYSPRPSKGRDDLREHQCSRCLLHQLSSHH